MVGNDVVDLAGGPPRHPRFDARVFDDDERALLAASPDAERLRWALWAAKESAYKAARKDHPGTVFAPSRFAVRVHDDGRATVRAGARCFVVEISHGPDHLHAIARDASGPPGTLHAAVNTLAADAVAPPGPQDAVRRLAITTLAGVLGVDAADLSIRRAARVPALWIRGRPARIDLSLSHHGRFVAFACAVP